MCVGVSVWLVGLACHTDTTPTSHTETPTHIETRTHNQCGDKIEKSQAPDDGCINLLAPELYFLILAHPVYKM